MKSCPHLTTKNLYFRRLEKTDLSDLIILESDPEVMQNTSLKRALSRGEIEERLHKSISQIAGKEPIGVWGVFSLKDHVFTGWSMLDHTGQNYLEIGYMLPKHMWGKGYATEIVRGLKNYAFKHLKEPGLCAITRKENTASISVLMKNGFVFESQLEDDLVKYQCENG